MKKVSKKRTLNRGVARKQKSQRQFVARDAAPSSNEYAASGIKSSNIIVPVPLSRETKEIRCPRFPAAVLLGCIVSLLCGAGWAVSDYSRLAKLSLDEQELIDELTHRNDTLTKEAANLRSQIAQLSYRVRAAKTHQRTLTDGGAHYMGAAGLRKVVEPLDAELDAGKDEWTAWGDVGPQLPNRSRSRFLGQGGVGGSGRSCSVTRGECKRGALKSAKISQKSDSKSGATQRRGTFTRLTSSRALSRSSKIADKPSSLKISSPSSQSTSLFQPTAGRVTSHFGIRRSPFRRGRQMHEGMDIDCSSGAPIHAAGAGMVLAVGRHGSYGLIVDIAHAGGIKTRYAHLSSALVRAGAPIARGAILGRCGSSGRSTGAHLHFEVHQNGSPVDPRLYIFRGNRVPSRSSQSIQVASSNKIDNRSKGNRRIG